MKFIIDKIDKTRLVCIQHENLTSTEETSNPVEIFYLKRLVCELEENYLKKIANYWEKRF